jgi:uncharacterized protein with NRDE domain
VCTVLLRIAPDTAWPLLLAAVRDEFADRPWDPPSAHWPDLAPGVVGGRDRVAGGTWLAVRREPPAVAAVLNGVVLAPPTSGVRRSRGGLPLALLTGGARLDATDLAGYDGFHLLLGTPTAVTVWSWDGTGTQQRDLAPGDHIIVNLGVDTPQDALVPHFAPLLARVPTPPLEPHSDTEKAWGAWVHLLRGDGLDPDDDRALIVRKVVAGRAYASTSASLVAVSRDGVRMDFTTTPATPSWFPVPLPSPV